MGPLVPRHRLRSGRPAAEAQLDVVRAQAVRSERTIRLVVVDSGRHFEVVIVPVDDPVDLMLLHERPEVGRQRRVE
jgi:hypothetical protein